MSPRQRRGTSEPQQRREPESASFETARIGGGRGRPPVFVIGFVAILASVIAVGVGGQTPPAATFAPPVAAVSPSASTDPSPVATPPAVVFPVPTPGQASDGPPTIGTAGGPIELIVRRQPESIYVHGDVFVPRVTWVYISLQDAQGQIAGWASVSVPGGAGPAATDGPSLRFDVDVAVHADLSDRALWLQATAYDATGKVIGSARIGIRPDGGAIAGPEESVDGFGDLVPIRLDAPVHDDQVVLGDTVLVEGRLGIRAQTVRIRLEDGVQRVLDSTTVDTANRDGGIRPLRAPTFAVELTIPTRGSQAPIWVVITAYDEAGEPLASMRRSIWLGQPGS